MRDGTVTTDWLCIQLQPVIPADPFDSYMHLSGLVNGVTRVLSLPVDDFHATLVCLSTCMLEEELRLLRLSSHRVAARLPVGWCSWYHFYENISEACLDDNIHEMHRLNHSTLTKHEQRQQKEQRLPNAGLEHAGETRRLNLFQVDDGYQRAWGDWDLLKTKEFPSGSLRPLVERIKAQGLVPGLWLAPFSCDKHSEVARLHPEWVLRNINGKPYNSANCGKWFYGLDVTNPEVQQFVRDSLSLAISTWGFEYLKLDFLYSAVLGAKDGTLMDKGLTGAQAMQVGMRLIRNTIKEIKGTEGEECVTLLGCGAALGSAIGHVHINRISADAGMCYFNISIPAFSPLTYTFHSFIRLDLVSHAWSNSLQ